jgi:2'-5' RNA ligase
MAFIGIKVPTEVLTKLSALEVTGEKVDPSEMHITLLYLGKSVPLAQIIKAIAVCAKFAETMKPFMVGCAKQICFPANPEDGVPVIARIQSPSIVEFREAMRGELEKAGVQYSNKYEYKPHVTLAYADEPCPDQDFEPITWTVNEFTIWGGNEMGEKVETVIQLLG